MEGFSLGNHAYCYYWSPFFSLLVVGRNHLVQNQRKYMDGSLKKMVGFAFTLIVKKFTVGVFGHGMTSRRTQ